jgi:hypothetical protein
MQGAGVYGLINEPEPVTAADLNLDSHITLDEFMTVADRRFDLLDTKHQGYLTLADLPKTAAQIAMNPPGKGRDKGHDRGRDSTSDQPSSKTPPP